jgi:hypothetical protein
MRHPRAESLSSWRDLDYTGRFEILQSPLSSVRRQAESPEARAPKEHRIFASFGQDHAVKLDQDRPSVFANTVTVQLIESAIMRHARERLDFRNAA